jgi:hypothetical protein
LSNEGKKLARVASSIETLNVRMILIGGKMVLQNLIQAKSQTVLALFKIYIPEMYSRMRKRMKLC